ncbi:hypothetical protein [Nocardiopsis quinghaiensis]|uniref:hypothetical protein n=1 Tax=Nocardiopsis quinghaiensis TaxID=464995 RepID=UPI001239CF54|nr:hypothetical protein [Nocardiopsis quinghaiensis]
MNRFTVPAPRQPSTPGDEVTAMRQKRLEAKASEWQRTMDLMIALNNALTLQFRTGTIDSGLRTIGDMPILVTGCVVVEVEGPDFSINKTDHYGDILTRHRVSTGTDVHSVAKLITRLL